MRAAQPTHELDTEAQAQALQRAALTLVTLASTLHAAVPADPAATLHALGQAMTRFEQDAAAHGCDAPTVTAASYLLCTWVDEVVASTPWARDPGGAGLLQRFHGEAQGGETVLRLLSRLAEQPERQRPLLLLFHACLSLGLQARWRGRADASQHIDALRLRVADLLHLGRDAGTTPSTNATGRRALSPAWPEAVPDALRRRRIWPWAAVLVLAFVASGLYAALRLRLAAQADEVFAAVQSLESGSALAMAAPAAALGTVKPRPTPPRWAPSLQSDLAAGRLAVLDAPHRSIVTLPADALFSAGTSRLQADGQALLQHVVQAPGAAAGPSPRLLVAAYTDGRDPRSARWPSAWHLTEEWATQVARALQRELPRAQIRVESHGAAPAERAEAGTPGTPPRRVEIHWFP
jgi:type VI secretion system protein ImpK